MEHFEAARDERVLMERALALCERASRYLELSCGATPAEIDLVGVGMLARAAHRQATPEARMCELQALVRRWVRETGAAAPPQASWRTIPGIGS